MLGFISVVVVNVSLAAIIIYAFDLTLAIVVAVGMACVLIVGLATPIRESIPRGFWAGFVLGLMLSAGLPCFAVFVPCGFIRLGPAH